MATYGSFPGVKITTTGGGITGVSVGEEEKLVIFAPGTKQSGGPDYNDPTQIASTVEADDKFGKDSLLAKAMKLAISNGANFDYLYGVMVESKTQTDVLTGGDHTAASKLTQTPIDESSMTVAEDNDTNADFETAIADTIKWETNTDATTSDFTGLSPGADEVFWNPATGEWNADASGDYEFSYSYYDYSTAIDAADVVFDEGDTGIYGVCTEAPDTHTKVENTINSLRNNYLMIQAVAPARPNKTLADGEPGFDSSNYSDNTDNDAVYLIAPGRRNNVKDTVVPAVAGMMAGHTIQNPIYNDILKDVQEVPQLLSNTSADDLRGEDVIPLRQYGSKVRIKANRSTGYTTNADWERDFWRRRIVDRVLLIAKLVGDDTLGRINDEDTREDAEDAIFGELTDLVRKRLLKPNTADETRWTVSVTEDSTNTDQVNIAVGVTPQGVVKQISETITIST